MRSIALLTSADMVPGAPNPRADAYEFELQYAALSAPCEARGLRLVSVVWDAPAAAWSAYDGVVIGTAWDYLDRYDAFIATLDSIEAAGTPLFNGVDVVRWNLDKRYLAELADHGAPSIPTLWRERIDAGALEAAFDQLDCDDIVAKPRLGASGVGVVRLRRGEPPAAANAMPQGAGFIQPFLPGVVTDGEVSYIFYDGAFSHAVKKRPAEGDYRVQSIYGGRESVHAPSRDERDAAGAVLAAAPADLLYARVDMAPDLVGRPALMELELVEPYHYPEQGPDCGVLFAAALERRLG